MNNNNNNLNPPPKENTKKFNWLKFFFLIAIIAIIGFFIYDSCTPKFSTYQPTTVYIDTNLNKNTQEIIFEAKIGSTPYKFALDGKDNLNDSLDEFSRNTSVNYYFNSSSRIVWDVYINVKIKDASNPQKYSATIRLNFKITQYVNEPGLWRIGYYEYDHANNGSELINGWLNRSTTANALTPTTETPWWIYLLQFAPQIIIILLFLMIMRKSMGSMGTGGDGDSIFSIGKSQAKLIRSPVRFTDVAGIQEEKEELMEVVDYLRNPMKYAAMGARVPKGVILYGPPGTGKTLLAKAVSGEANVPFFQVAGSSFDDMLVGSGAKRIRDLFNRARKVSPAIIFIDEIDSVASKRGRNEIIGGGGGIADQTINQLLAEMDGFNTTTGIILIAATNRIDVLDEAILRPGRFDRHIQVNLPDIKEREEILKIHSRNKNISSAVKLNDIARRTPGMSGAQLENILNEATLLAVRRNKNSIQIDDVDEGIDRVIAGPAKRSRVFTEKERERIATHEAGHALVGLYTPGSDVVEKITIIPRGMAAGYTVSNPEKQESRLQTKNELLGMVCQLLSGRAAEEVCFGKDSVSTGAANDLYRVTNIVRSMVMQLGMSDISMSQLVPSEGQANPYSQKIYSETTAQKADQEVESIIKKQYGIALSIIAKNMKELKLIVETLLLLETILKPQIDYIHKSLKLPAEAIEAKEKIKKENEKKKD